MTIQQAFEILEIEITQEQIAIKRAYAQLVKKYHPEEYPDEWKRVHDAYEYAMNYAGRKQDNIDRIISTNGWYEKSISEEWEKEEEVNSFIMDESEQEEAEFNFRNIENLFEQESKKRRDEQDNVLVDALNRMSELEKKKKISVKQWVYILRLPEIQAAKTNPAFLYCLGDFLKNVKVDTSSYNALKEFLYDVKQELQEDLFCDESGKALLTAFKVVVEALEEAYWVRGSGTIKKIFEQASNIVMAFAVTLMIVLAFLYKSVGDEAPNQVILPLEVVDVYGGLWFGEGGFVPSQYAKSGWNVWSNGFSDRRREELGINIEGDIVTCFYIGHLETEIDDVKVFLIMKDFGLESGNYEVWQYDGKQYICETVSDTANSEYPYEERGKLYIPTKVHKVDDRYLNDDEYYPVVIIRTESEME